MNFENDFKQVTVSRYETLEDERCREDSRWHTICHVTNDTVSKDIPNMVRWPNLKSIGISIHNSTRDRKDCNVVRYYILSKYLTGKNRRWRCCEVTVGHREQPSLARVVTFNEVQKRIRKGHADANFIIPLRTALSMLKHEKMAKVGVENKRLQARWDEDDLENALLG